MVMQRADTQGMQHHLDEISAKLARNDLAAFETQGRFIESRYKDEQL